MDFQLLDRSTTRDGWRCRVAISGRNPAFEGHFPGSPVLPAIAHLAVAAQALAAVLGHSVEIVGVPFLRLRRPVLPDDVLDVTIGNPASDGAVPFDIGRDEERLSNGILVVHRRG